ncbi:hypothetical protein BDE02_06G145600 [Populus trichocarpa]|nr:hypothetical protein BDE02_06G145600 [Populus trichocarpa]
MVKKFVIEGKSRARTPISTSVKISLDFTSIVALSVVLLVSNWQHWTYGKATPQVPCYFVFGDSLFDNGNNNYLTTPVKVNYLPYGIDFPLGATGRCSNGLNIADTIAEQLGFDSFITDFGVGGFTNFLDGVNYGSSGAGILDETGYLSRDLFTMNIQLYNHKITVSRIAKQLGGDDQRDIHPDEYAQHLIKNYKTQLEDLYSTGARKIAVFGLIRVGCMPSNIQQYPNELDDSLCAYKLNDDVKIFNSLLQTMLEELNEKHKDAVFTYINSYDIDSDVTNAGFKHTRESCCQVLQSGAVPCQSLSVPCANRSEYVYWDGAHFTEAKAWAFGKRAFKRQLPQDAHPYDISELVKLELHDNDVNNVNLAQL